MAGPKLAEWARKVKERDRCCCECGSNEDLHAHHIKPKATHPELMFDVWNGKTLCYRCHKKEHARCRVYRPRDGVKRPQRKTLERRIGELEREVVGLRKVLADEKREVRRLRWKYERNN